MIRIEDADTLSVKKIPRTKNSEVIYCQSAYRDELLALYNGKFPKGSVSKELNPNQDLQISGIKYTFSNEENSLVDAYVVFNTMMGEEIRVDLLKEKDYFDAIGVAEENIISWLNQPDAEEYFSFNEDPRFLTIEPDSKIRGSLLKYHQKTIHKELLTQIKKPNFAYTAKILSKNDGGFFINVCGIKGFMPGSLAATNRILDFDQYIGKEVVVMIEDYIQETGLFIVSHKKYIQYILPTAIRKLKKKTPYEGVVTGSSKWGIFVEFENIFTGLIQEKNMDDETKRRWQSREIKDQTTLEVYIKSIDKNNNRIHLSSFLDVADQETEELSENLEGKVVQAVVKLIKPFGALVKIPEINQLCLLPQKEITKKRKTLKIGESLSLTIDKIDEEKGKILMRFMA